MKKRILSFTLVACLVFALIPAVSELMYYSDKTLEAGVVYNNGK